MSARVTPPPRVARRATEETLRHLTSLAAGLALGFTAVAAPAGPARASDPLARGKYLVDEAGQCQDCHTPRNEKGEYVREQWLLGSEIGFKPLVPMPWMAAAPPIAGLPTLTREQAVHFLMTGERPGRPKVTPPMPEYRFDRADAEAIVAYLKSLAK
jgi:mono/diheme cytochrome c family protein